MEALRSFLKSTAAPGDNVTVMIVRLIAVFPQRQNISPAPLGAPPGRDRAEGEEISTLQQAFALPVPPGWEKHLGASF